MNSQSRNYLLGAIAGVVAISSLIFFASRFTQKDLFNKTLMHTASELNKTCPIMIDSQTRLDNTIVLPGNTFEYNYTIVNYSKDELDTTKLINNIRPGIINTVKTNPDLKIFRSHKVTMAYTYKDKNGIYLFRVFVTPNDYLN